LIDGPREGRHAIPVGPHAEHPPAARLAVVDGLGPYRHPVGVELDLHVGPVHDERRVVPARDVALPDGIDGSPLRGGAAAPGVDAHVAVQSPRVAGLVPDTHAGAHAAVLTPQDITLRYAAGVGPEPRLDRARLPRRDVIGRDAV